MLVVEDGLVVEVALPFEDVADSMFVAGLHLRPQVVILAHAILSDAAIGAASDADDYRSRTWVNATGNKITKDDAR